MFGFGDGWCYCEIYFIGEDVDEFDRVFGMRFFDIRNLVENMRVKVFLRCVSILLLSSFVCGVFYCNFGYFMFFFVEGL